MMVLSIWTAYITVHFSKTGPTNGGAAAANTVSERPGVGAGCRHNGKLRIVRIVNTAIT